MRVRLSSGEMPAAPQNGDASLWPLQSWFQRFSYQTTLGGASHLDKKWHCQSKELRTFGGMPLCPYHNPAGATRDEVLELWRQVGSNLGLDPCLAPA